MQTKKPSDPGAGGSSPAALCQLLGAFGVPVILLLYWQYHDWAALAWNDLRILTLPCVGLCLLAGVLAVWKPERPRVPALYAGILFLFLYLLSILGISAERMLPRILTGVLAELICLCACSLGLRLTRSLADALSPLERFAFSMGAGMWAIGCAAALLGLAGLLYAPVFWCMLALCLLAGIYDWLPWWRDVRDSCKSMHSLSPLGWSLLAFVLLGVGMLICASFMPPLDYDVLEYHLQMPKEYLQNGAITFLPHNAFSGFPQQMEMVTLLSFVLRGVEEGVWLTKLLHFSFLPLLCLVLGLLVWRLLPPDSSRRWQGALLAVAVLLACVQTVALSMKLYVELAFSAFFLLALLCVWHAWQTENMRRWAVWAGVFAGAATCCKYTGFLFVGMPVCVLLAIPLYAHSERIRWNEHLRAACVAGVVCWAVVAPWLIKNAVTTGNPFYPLWNEAFRVEGWTSAQEERFHDAHRPSDYSFASMKREAGRLFIGTTAQRLGIMAFAGWPLLLFAFWNGGRKRREWLAIGGVLLGGTLLWFVLTHRLERFYYPLYLLAICFSGVGVGMLPTREEKRGAWLWLLPASIGLMACSAFCGIVGAQYFSGAVSWSKTPLITVLLGKKAPETVLQEAYSPWPLRLYMQKMLKASDRVLLVGSAEPFWLPENIEYSMVFSRHPLFDWLADGLSAREIRTRLQARGITHLYIHWPELARLHATYTKAYDLSPAAQEEWLRLLRDETATLRPVPLGRPWDIKQTAEKRPYLQRLVQDYSVLFATSSARGPALAPYEVYVLRTE